MRVADQDRVDSRDLLGDKGGGVLRPRQCIPVRGRRHGSGMRGDDQHVDPATQLGDIPLRLFDQPGERHLPLDVGLVPDGDTGVGQTEDADLERAGLRGANQLDRVGLEGRTLGPGVQGIRPEQREVELPFVGPQQRYAVVELMIAERRGVVLHGVHRGRHRVDDLATDGVDLRVVVRERRALDGVSRIDQQRVLIAPGGPQRIDQARHLGQPDVVVRRVLVLGVLEVVPIEDVAVQVGGAHDGEPIRLPVVPDGRGFGGVVEADSGQHGGRRGSGDERAAGHSGHSLSPVFDGVTSVGRGHGRAIFLGRACRAGRHTIGATESRESNQTG